MRVTGSDGRSVVVGCGTDDLHTAKAMQQMIKTLARKRQWKALDMIVEKRAKLPQVFDAYDAGQLDAWLARSAAPDLVPLLNEWPGSERYKTQIKRLVGDSFLASDFTRKRISTFLSELRIDEKRVASGSTRNRYKAALSVFARWLVEREIIEHNPVRDVRGATPNPGKLVWLEREQAKALVAALPLPYRAIDALMAATGVEWQVIERVQRRDIDFEARTLHAKGSKTPWRNRTVRATELWAWEIFAEYARDFTPNALIFGGVNKYKALHVHLDAAETLKLPRTTLHDWRHTYAVLSLKLGYKDATVAHQLGHRDAHLVRTRYGRFIPDERDYVLQTAPLAQASGRGE